MEYRGTYGSLEQSGPICSPRPLVGARGRVILSLVLSLVPVILSLVLSLGPVLLNLVYLLSLGPVLLNL